MYATNVFNMDASVNRGKRVRKGLKRWTEEENRSILDYLQETVNNGRVIEKPSARLYYERLIREKRLKGCDFTLVRNKVRNMQTKYQEALTWQNDEGQDMLETEGEDKYKDVLKKRFPYVKQFQNIWGEKFTNRIPFKYLPSPNPILDELNIHETENGLVEVFIHDGINNNSHDGLNSPTMEQDDTVDIEDVEPVNETSESDISNYSTKQSRKSKRPVKKRQESAQSAYLEASLARDKVNKKTLDIKKEEIELKRQKFEDDLDIKTKRLELKREKFTHRNQMLAEFQNKELEFQRQCLELERQQMEVKKLEIETNREIRLLELQIEKTKWEYKLKGQNS